MNKYILLDTENGTATLLKDEQAVIDTTNKLLVQRRLSYCYEDDAFKNNFYLSLAILKFNNFKLAKFL